MSYTYRTYRACFYTCPDTGQETVLTGEEHSDLPDEELFQEALEEADRAGIVGDEWPRISEAKLIDNLSIGDWRD